MSIPAALPGVGRWVRLSTYMLLSGLLGGLLIACSGAGVGGNGGTVGATATASQTELSALHWCGKPFMIFRDEGTLPTPTASAAAAASATAASTTTATAVVVGDGTVGATATSAARTITDWAQVKPKLGFTVFLPTKLPNGSCLVSASGTLHDPIFGSSFTIGYLLPDHSALSLSEAPLRSQNTEFQCSASSSSGSGNAGGGTPKAQQVPVQLCSGAREKTNIVLSARGSTSALQKLFQSLQSDVNWIPA